MRSVPGALERNEIDEVRVEINCRHYFDQVDEISTKTTLIRLMTSSDDDLPSRYLHALLWTSFVNEMQIYRSRYRFAFEDEETNPKVEKGTASSRRKHKEFEKLEIRREKPGSS